MTVPVTTYQCGLQGLINVIPGNKWNHKFNAVGIAMALVLEIPTVGTQLPGFEERSILWIAISAGLGGVIGALINFVFQQVLTPHLEHQRRAKQALRRYCHPLLRAADKLDRRLENFINFADKGWFGDPDDDYYRLSTLYLFGVYFGWCKILEDEAFLEYESSNKKARLFNIRFYTVFKAITGFHYFSEVPDGQLELIEQAAVPRLVLTAIGELMMEERTDKGESPNIIKFTDFTKRYQSSPEFQRWFFYIERLLKDVRPTPKSARWNRIIVFAAMLRSFTLFLDPEHRVISPREISYLSHLHPQVRSYLEKEMHGLCYFQEALTKYSFLKNLSK
jgi:hypothetical protein